MRPVALLQTLLLGALVLVAVVSLNYSLPHAGRGPAAAGAGSSSAGAGTPHLAGRKLGAQRESHQHAAAGKERAATEAAADAVLTVHLHCGDQATDCKLRRHRGMCSMNLTHDFDSCLATCGVCPALALALRASMNLTAAQLLVTPARGPPACADANAGVCAALVADTDTGSACAASPPAVLGACKATCKACQAPASVAGELGGASGSSSGEDGCFDAADMCGWWAAREPRICERAAASMQRWWWVAVACRRTCGLCGGDGAGAGGAAAAGAALRVAASYGVQVGEDVDGTPRVAAYEALPADPASCKDREAKCAEWVAAGECVKNAGFMAASCAASCGACPVALNLPRPLAKVRLNNGVLMPTVGYGCAGLGESAGDTVQWALEAGYRHLDSAQAREWYREDLVGRALNRFLEAAPAANASAAGAGAGAKSVRREDVFVTSKLHPRHLGYEVTLRQFNETLKDLRSGYVDLFLLHYPECWGDLCGGVAPAGTFLDSWRALEAVYQAGLARAIGISNFAPHHVTQLLAKAVVRPAVLQVHVDPLDHADALQLLCRSQSITLTAYSTLGTQYGGGKNPVLTSPVLAAIGKELGEAAAGQAGPAGGGEGGSGGEGRGGGDGAAGAGAGAGGRGVAQVALRWALQQGLVVLPRSSNRGRIAQNLQLYDWSLTPDQMRRIEAL
ncbi:hypothetical protein HXX76_004823 [Chlamydomonas incerta]|uniref:ShKT domain-containing protein n=1 Tax=Chlamydomonas incerta TaxID=51695 RepID=A0A835W6Y3_CHLIN|nr:hypothetical protein HXX76_004823 [Chlamydomonas incerta]|eukprot:KAG2439469.1 hypothetical protein HXX76_004823 [Chlamydomonas incerta]